MAEEGLRPLRFAYWRWFHGANRVTQGEPVSVRNLYLMPLFSRSRTTPSFTGQRTVVNDRDRRTYPEFRAGREKAWRTQGAPYSTAKWPAELEDGTLAVLLLPISAGRLGPAVGKHPRTVASPLFTLGRSVDGSRNDACLSVLTSWVTNPSTDSVTARRAPPVVEVFQGSRVVERVVETFGASWPLPGPDGL